MQSRLADNLAAKIGHTPNKQALLVFKAWIAGLTLVMIKIWHR